MRRAAADHLRAPSEPVPDETRAAAYNTGVDGIEQHALGPYTILEELGRGSMGVVYRAVHANLNRTVALKVLRRFEGDEAALAGRFHREAQAAARLSHPNIVAVHDAGEIDGRSYIAMDFVDGPTLAAVAQSGRKPRKRMLATLVKVARAVHYASTASSTATSSRPIS